MGRTNAEAFMHPPIQSVSSKVAGSCWELASRECDKHEIGSWAAFRFRFMVHTHNGAPQYTHTHRFSQLCLLTLNWLLLMVGKVNQAPTLASTITNYCLTVTLMLTFCIIRTSIWSQWEPLVLARSVFILDRCSWQVTKKSTNTQSGPPSRRRKWTSAPVHVGWQFMSGRSRWLPLSHCSDKSPLIL